MNINKIKLKKRFAFLKSKIKIPIPQNPDPRQSDMQIANSRIQLIVNSHS